MTRFRWSDSRLLKKSIFYYFPLDPSLSHSYRWSSLDFIVITGLWNKLFVSLNSPAILILSNFIILSDDLRVCFLPSWADGRFGEWPCLSTEDPGTDVIGFLLERKDPSQVVTATRCWLDQSASPLIFYFSSPLFLSLGVWEVGQLLINIINNPWLFLE